MACDQKWRHRCCHTHGTGIQSQSRGTGGTVAVQAPYRLQMESLEAAHAAEVDPEESQPTTVEISDEKYANMDEFAMPYKVRGPPQEIITCPLL